MASNKTNSSRRVTPGISFAHHSKACGAWERSFHLKVHYCSLVLRISSLLPTFINCSSILCSKSSIIYKYYYEYILTIYPCQHQ